MANPQWPLAIGTQGAWEVDLYDDAGLPITAFLASDGLSAVVWAGDDQALLFAPTCSWLDAPHGKFRVLITSAMAATLPAGWYNLLCYVTPSGQDPILAASIDLLLTATPGSAVPARSYCTANDLRLYAPWIEQVQADDADQAGFASQRGRATSWLDDCILARYSGNVRGYGVGLSYGAGSLLGSLGLAGVDPGESWWLRAQLALGLLMVRDKTREIVARKAIALICASRLGERDGTPYQALAVRFEREAEQIAKTYRAEIDLNADGYPDIVVNLGATSLR